MSSLVHEEAPAYCQSASGLSAAKQHSVGPACLPEKARVVTRLKDCAFAADLVLVTRYSIPTIGLAAFLILSMQTNAQVISSGDPNKKASDAVAGRTTNVKGDYALVTAPFVSFVTAVPATCKPYDPQIAVFIDRTDQKAHAYFCVSGRYVSGKNVTIVAR